MKGNNTDQFCLTCKALKMEMPVREYKFHPTRKWRCDYAWPDIRLCVELEGGVYTRGRHVRGKGYENDLEKYNHLVIDGWSLLRYMPTKINWNEIELMYKLNKEVKRRLEKI